LAASGLIAGNASKTREMLDATIARRELALGVE